MKLRLPDSYHNLISYIGTVVAIVFLAMFIFLYVLSSIASLERAYEGVVIFMVIPVFIILGLLMIPLGMIVKTRRHHRAAKKGIHLGVLDLNKPQNRNAAVIFLSGSVFFIFLSALGSYKAYHFTDSVLFCGTLCHSVMHPEYTTYQTSPHARVSCAECHVGPGASWYVKSKLSGLYQVYATIANSYPRPIPAPIKSLRPARETCEQCHWPEKVYGKQQRLEIHYLPDKDNTRWNIEMLLNTGAGNPALGFKTGIHWHSNKEIQIEYIHTDEGRLVIPRVIMTHKKTGERIVFNTTEKKITEEDLSKYPPRIMDCIDCHNRPSHIFMSPVRFINIAIASGKIDPTLPFIKKVAVEASLGKYQDVSQARESIAQKINKYYADHYPDILKDQPQRIQTSIAGIQQAYSLNIFPIMKVRWEAYPDHIGHLNTPGCWRCHDGQHVSEGGRTISHHCDLCHTIYGQGPSGRMAYSSSDSSLEFRHPEDIEEAWKEMACAECHSGPPF
jgi:fumarate reductase subunit C